MTAPRARIRLDALADNLERLRQAAGGAKVIAVVKANAYGHGLLTIARNLPGADGFAVARFDDALTLDGAGLGRPIVLFGGVYSQAEQDAALGKGIELVVHCNQQVELLEAAPPGKAVVWLKLDSGMRRLGFEVTESEKILRRLTRCQAVGEVRLMTHLANADDRRNDRTNRQLDRFRPLLKTFDGAISIANSPGLLGWPDAIDAGADRSRCWVRCGIALYGISPFAGTTGADFGLRPVMQFQSSLIATRAIRAGERVGYGGTWQSHEDTVVGIVAAGYGDGYLRYLPSGSPVLVNDRRASLAGLVSMDMAAVDLGPDATDSVGDPVTLWGDGLPVEEVAACAGTTPYTLVCGIPERNLSD